jgi:hypothetical protein
MAQVCLVGKEELNLRYELLSRETARDALVAYDLGEPFSNAVAVDTVSLGAAVALLNDLDWYLVRFVAHALVYEQSVSESEWLSRDLATAIRDDEVDPADTGRFLKMFGVVESEADDGDGASDSEDPADEAAGHADDTGGHTAGPPRLVEPMLVTRTGETIPEYDLREVDDTLIVRVTESEFGA